MIVGMVDGRILRVVAQRMPRDRLNRHLSTDTSAPPAGQPGADFPRC